MLLYYPFGVVGNIRSLSKTQKRALHIAIAHMSPFSILTACIAALLNVNVMAAPGMFGARGNLNANCDVANNSPQ